jgi:tight adherence protein B
MSRAGRRHLLAGALLVLLCAVQGSAWASTPTVHIRAVDERRFPTVSVTVSVGGVASVSPSDVAITENGRPATGISVRTLGGSGTTVDVVLAIDVSDSVAGAPLASAVAAARNFIFDLPPGLQVGVVTFASEANVVLPITSDHNAAVQALGGLTTSKGTALYDGVATAAGLFTGSGQHNIVLLTDGRNIGGARSADDAIGAAVRAHAAVFAIGLQSRQLDPPPLQALADRTGGSYQPVTEADLAAIYQQVAVELSHQYVVTYHSPSANHAQVALRVSVFGGSDDATVLTPAAPPPPPPVATGPPHPALLHGTVGLAVVLGLCFVTMFLLIVMAFGATARNRRQKDLARRMAVEEWTKPTDEAPARPDVGIANWIPDPVVAAANRVARAGGFGDSLEARLERARSPLSGGEFLSVSVLAAAGGGLVGAVVLQSWLFAFIFAAVAALVPTIWLSVATTRRHAKLQGQLADAVALLASSLRAGHSFLQALDMVSKELADPAGPEFQRVVAEIRLGRSVDDALSAMAERLRSDDLRWAVLAVNIQREVGGNLAELLDTVGETIRERQVLRRQVRVLSAEGRLSIKILVALPFLIVLYIMKINPGYMNVLFTTRLGWIMLGTAGALMAVGIVWARKVVDIDV